MNRAFIYTATVTCILGGPVYYAEVPALVQTAFDNCPPVAETSWAYTRTSEIEGRTWVERHDPASPSRWQLLTVDGVTPTEREHKIAAKKWSKEDKHPDRKFGANRFDELADPDSWRLQESTGAFNSYTFRPSADKDSGKQFDTLQGELVIDTDKEIVSSFRIYSTAPFKPAAIVKIEAMNSEFRLQRIQPGTVLPTEIRMAVKGRAFGLKKFDRNTVIRYSDFIPASAQGPMPASPRQPYEHTGLGRE